jgi:hypothetical protein
MTEDVQALKDEIERVEKELEAQHFRGLFDRRNEQKLRKKLKKLRRQLDELTGTATRTEPVRRAEPKHKPTPKPKKPKPAKAVAREPVSPARSAAAKKPSAVKAKKSPAKEPAKRKPVAKKTVKKAAAKKPAKKTAKKTVKKTVKKPAKKKKK